MKKKLPDLLEIASSNADPDQQLAALDEILEGSASGATRSKMHHAHRMLLEQQNELRKRLGKSELARVKAESVAEKLMSPPFVPGLVTWVGAGGQFEVATPGRRQVVIAHPDLDADALCAGVEVLLDTDMSVIVTQLDPRDAGGQIGVVAEVTESLVVVRCAGDEELLAGCRPEVLGELSAGDRVAYVREIPLVLRRLPERDESRFALTKPPQIGFAAIGGLQATIDEIRSDLDLHLLYRERVAAYQLRMLRGILLVGRPGLGKTMIAEAIASYVAEISPDTSFLSVPPGALRGSFFGETEGRIRELFRVARAAAGLVVIFFDELDSYGSRGGPAGPGTTGGEIDGRVLGTLLAEIQGLGSASNVLCIGATNRLDLCDDALVRPGRFGDRIYELPRPNREATREILSRYVSSELPFVAGGSAELLLDAASSYLHSARGGAAPLAEVTLTNGDHREVRARDVLSGALLEMSVDRAKRAAALRALDGEPGIGLSDLLAALDEALLTEARKLEDPYAARRLLDIPGADQIARVDLEIGQPRPSHDFVRAA